MHLCSLSRPHDHTLRQMDRTYVLNHIPLVKLLWRINHTSTGGEFRVSAIRDGLTVISEVLAGHYKVYLSSGIYVPGFWDSGADVYGSGWGIILITTAIVRIIGGGGGSGV